MLGEDQEDMMTNDTSDLPVDFRLVEDKTVRGLRTRAQADSLRELTERGLLRKGRGEDFRLSVEERADGLFDLVVLKRVN